MTDPVSHPNVQTFEVTVRTKAGTELTPARIGNAINDWNPGIVQTVRVREPARGRDFQIHSRTP